MELEGLGPLLLGPRPGFFAAQRAAYLGRRCRQPRELLPTPLLPPLVLLLPSPPAEVWVLNRGLFCFSLQPLNVDVLGH